MEGNEQGKEEGGGKAVEKIAGQWQRGREEWSGIAKNGWVKRGLKKTRRKERNG